MAKTKNKKPEVQQDIKFINMNPVKICDALFNVLINSRGYDCKIIYTLDGMTREEYIKAHNLDMT